MEDPPRDSDGGISPGLRVATEGLRIDEELEPDPALVEGFEGVGAGRSARRFFASSVSIERPSFSTCSASAARSASSSWAGSTVMCTKPRTGTMPETTRGAPTGSSGGRSPKATRRTPSKELITSGCSSVPTTICAPSAV